MIKQIFDWFKRSKEAPQPLLETPIEKASPRWSTFTFEAPDDIVLYRHHAKESEALLAETIKSRDSNAYWPTVILFNRDVEEFLLERGIFKVAQLDSKEIRYHEVHSNWQTLVFQNERDMVEFKLRFL